MFKIRSFPRKTLHWWRQRESSIDFDPDFQRTSRVWSERDKAFLIDSILNGFDIPKIYIADFTTHDIPTLNVRHKSYAIIDGKQRLSAIFAFFGDRLPLQRKFFLPSAPTQNLGNLLFSGLKREHPKLANLVERYILDVKAIETDDRKKINEVFLRLNKASKALNGAEVRNAMMGKAVDAIRDVGKHRFFVRRIRFATNRGQERNAAAKLLTLEYEGGPAATKKKNLDTFVVTIGEQSSGRFNGTLRRVKANLNVLCDIFQNQDPLLGAQGHIPLYYLFITRLRVSDRNKVRAFLEAFEKKRVRNRNRTSGGGERDFDAYDLASRSTNDKGSFETRLRVIRAKFAAWKKRGVV
jgi:hypothetical protein